LLGRLRYELDAAADEGPGITVPASRRLCPPDDDGLAEWPSVETNRPLAWLNPPFSSSYGGKAAWSTHALAQAARGWLVAFYCPVYGDTWADVLEARAVTTIRIGGGRVRHVPPPGVKAETPMQTAHRIWLLGPERWRETLPARLVWNWKSEAWIS